VNHLVEGAAVAEEDGSLVAGELEELEETRIARTIDGCRA
jgi:hypothetical protein